MRAIVDREWYVPKMALSHGYFSVKIGDHLINEGIYNVRWPGGVDAESPKVDEALHVKMVGITSDDKGYPVNSVIPCLVIKHNGAKIMARIHEIDGIMMRRVN
jgi:hypothetical protein